MFTNRPSSAPPFAFPVAPPFAAPKAARTPSFHTKGNCLHLSGVEGPLGLRINGVYTLLDEHAHDSTKSRSYNHVSSAGIRAVHDLSACTWRVFDSDDCVAHWADSPPSASPESLHRFGVFHAENQQFEKALCAFQAAAAAGHAPSYFNVFLYLSESRPGVAIDLQGAFTAAQSGAAAGHMDSVAALAFCFFQGIGTEKNLAKAQALCSQSMEDFSPMACYVQGMMHLENGASALKKKRSAFPFMQIAASAEISASAAFHLALLLSEADDEFCDIPQAIQHLKFASALGMQSAKDLLARLEPQNSSLVSSSPNPPSNQSLGTAAGVQSASIQSVSSDSTFDLKSFESRFCRSFDSGIYVRTIDAADIPGKEKGSSNPDKFVLLPNVKACLAPNMLVISTEFADFNKVELHFPMFDSAGAYVPATPVKLHADHAMRSYNTGGFGGSGGAQCRRCSMYGPSSQTGHLECSVCHQCSTCCARHPICDSLADPRSSGAFVNPFPFPANVAKGSNCFSVPDMLKEQRSTVSGAYLASQSLWRNGFPVFCQVPLPNQKERFIVEFHMRLLNSSVGVWELKSEDMAGTSESLYRFNTGCQSALLTLPPVTMTGDESSGCRSSVELAGILAMLSHSSVNMKPDSADSYIAFCDREELRSCIQDTKSTHEVAQLKTNAVTKKSNHPKTKSLHHEAQDCVWLKSKTDAASMISGIAINSCPPMSVCVESCKGKNAIFVNGGYRFQHALFGEEHILFIYQSILFGSILGCLVQKNRVSCAISASAFKIFLQSKDQSSLEPFAFPREWTYVPLKLPPKPEPRIEQPAPQGNAFGFGFGQAQPHPAAPFGAIAPQLAPRQFPGFGGMVPAAAGAFTAAVVEPNQSTSELEVHDGNCSEMSIRAVESFLSGREPAISVWPSLSVLAEVLNKSSIVNKKPLLSHVWRHLVQRCGSPAAALNDLDLVFQLSSESAVNLKDIEDFSDYLSTTLDESLSDYISAIRGISTPDDLGVVSLAVHPSVASFLLAHHRPLLKSHLKKMYHAILDVLSPHTCDREVDASCSAGHANFKLYHEGATVVGVPFGLSAAEVLLIVNPFELTSDSVVPNLIACQWDDSFCNGANQSGWRHEMFTFSRSITVRFPSGPIHCPTSEIFGFDHQRKGYLNFEYVLNTNNAWSVGLIPVALLRDSTYLWNSPLSGFGSIGYSYGGGGCRLRPFPQSVLSRSSMKIFVGVDADAGTCSFYSDGHLISTDTVPSSMFPCVIAICGHNGSTFTIHPAADIPAEFGADVVSHLPSSSEVLDSKRHVSVFDTVLNGLFTAVLNDSFSHCHKTILDSAMCSLLGTQDHNLLKAAFHGATRIQAIFKADCASKVTLAIEKATAQCLECLLKCDPELSSLTISGLVSFISKVELAEIRRKKSAEMTLVYNIFLPVVRRLLKMKLDATECVSFLSDLDTTVPFPADYLNILARTLLPFMQTDEGTVVARILLDSSVELSSSPFYEPFFNALLLQLSTTPQRISGSIPFVQDQFSASESECVLVDIYGSRLACLVFKSSRLHSPHHPHHFGGGGYNFKVIVEVQVGNEKPSTHVIFNSISQLPSSLNVSLILETHGIFVFVESVPVCAINASIELVTFSKVVCSASSNFKVHNNKSHPGFNVIPEWMRLYFRSRLNQLALESSPISRSPMSAIMMLTQRVSLLADKLLPVNCSTGSSSTLVHAMLADQVDLNDESTCSAVICGAVDSLIQECRPFMRGDGIHDVADCSSLANAFRRYISVMSLTASNESKKQTACSSSSAPADIQFQSNAGSHLIADQQAPNIVQIVYKNPGPTQVSNSVEYEAIAKSRRRIPSFPIPMASFSAKVCVKDLNHDHVACVELCLSKPGSDASSRCSLQLYASGLLLRNGIWAGDFPQFAKKQVVTISVSQIGTVIFSVGQKAILELNVEPGSIGQLAVSYGGEGNSSIGPPIADGKEMFIIHLYHSSADSTNFPNTIVQRAMQNHFNSLSDRLHFASFAYSLSSILSPSVLKVGGTDFSAIQRSADKLFFDLLCIDGLASLCVSEENCLVHAVRIICDRLPEQPDLFKDLSLGFFKSILPGSSAAQVFASVIRSQIKSKSVLPPWCLRAISCFLCETFVSSDVRKSDDDIHDSLRSHISLNFDAWNLHLPPSDARAICNGSSTSDRLPESAACGPDCNQSHEGNCLLCGTDWGRHAGHECPNGGRGSWKLSTLSDPSSTSRITPQNDEVNSSCTCSTRRNSDTGLHEFVFNMGANIEVSRVKNAMLPFSDQSEDEKEFRKFLEWKRFKELRNENTDSTQNASSLTAKKHDNRCPVCFDKGLSVFGCPNSCGIFPGSTVSLKQQHVPALAQSSSKCVLEPGQTGFVICTYQSLALVQGPVNSGIISCEMLQLVSCVVSSLFYEDCSIQSLGDSVYFADVMSSLAKLGASHFPPIIQRSLSASSLSLIEELFSAFNPRYSGPFEFPFHEPADLLLLCRSASFLTGALKQVLLSRFASVNDLSKLLRLLHAFGSVNWEDSVPLYSFRNYASGIYEITRHIQGHFLSLLFADKKESSVSNEAVLYNLLSSLSLSESSYLAHVLKHSKLPCNFFIPLLHHVASYIVSGNLICDQSRIIFSFLQQCVPPGAFLQLRHALLQLSVCVPARPRLFDASKNFQVTRVQRWIIDSLVPHLGSSCAIVVDGEILSILPNCGWCDISLSGLSAFRVSIPEGLVLDAIYSSKAPLSLSDISKNVPLQEVFILEALKSLLSKQLISKTGLNFASNFVMSSQLSRSPTNYVARNPSFHSLGDRFCEVTLAIFTQFQSKPYVYEHQILCELCRYDDEVEGAFSCSFVAFVLSKLLASGTIARNGQFLVLKGKSLNDKDLTFEPREFLPSAKSCIRSMVVVVCDESASIPPLSTSAAGASESFPYDHAVSLVRESFARIHQETGIDLGEVSECFRNCKGNLIDTIYTLMFDPKFSSMRKSNDSLVSPGAGRIRYVEEALCPTCLCDKILVALPCDHRYCQECLQEYIQDSMANSSTPKAAGGADRAGGRLVTNICCPAHVDDCKYMISTKDVKFLATSEYATFVDLICRQSTRAMASGAFPTVTCSCGRLIVGHTTESEYECSCGQISCIGDVKNGVTLQNWSAHPFSSCLQEERWKEYTQVGSEARQLLMRTKKCPSCGTKTTKCGCVGVVICNQMDQCPNEACDHMTCGVCHSHWCWVCGRLGSTESRCTYPKHLISQAKELFKEAEVKVKQLEDQVFKNSWRVVRLDPSFNYPTVLSVKPPHPSTTATGFSLMNLTKGDRIITVNGRPVDSAENAQQALSCGWAPGHFLRVEYQRGNISKLLVCQVPSDSSSDQDSFVMRRSRIVQSVSDISGAAGPDSVLEKSRALLDKVVSQIFTDSEQAQVLAHNPSGITFASSSALLLSPVRRDERDIFTASVLNPRVKHFLQVADSISDAHSSQIVADLVAAQKTSIKSSSNRPNPFSAPAAEKTVKNAAPIIKRANMNLRVYHDPSLSSTHVGTLCGGHAFAFSKIDEGWAKLSPLHDSDLATNVQTSSPCVVSDFRPHNSLTNGFCIINSNGVENLEEPSEAEKTALLARYDGWAEKTALSARPPSSSDSNPVACYVWKSWAFAVSSSSKGRLNLVSFWCHNGAIKQARPPIVFGQSVQPAAPSESGLASSKVSGQEASPASGNTKVTRAVQRCDKFGGSIALLDQDQEAWLFDCPQDMTPIDSNSATCGRSIQSRPWESNVKPTFCESIYVFCNHLRSLSTEMKSTDSKSPSVMYSEELDAVMHRCGAVGLIIHGNGDWATCHASHLPSSFKGLELVIPQNSSPDSLCHVGSWDGCGGNISGVSACAGQGNCSSSCVNCGARSHWTCCGSNDMNSKTCCGPITIAQASENDRLFRLVVRKTPVPCCSIQGLSGGQFSCSPVSGQISNPFAP